MNVPRTLFEALKAGSFDLLKQWVDERRLEDLYLDFKLAESPMDKEGKKTLAEAVSGFANSEGGIIVWGVYAAKDPEEGVDGATERRPLADLKVFMSNLHEYTSRLVVPAPEGIEHHPIPDPEKPGSGYAITLVPRAEGAPHMAMGKGQQRFYFRSGDSFLPMEHFMVADRFSRRPQPVLELAYRWESPDDKTYLVLGIKNIGKGIALYPALQIEERISAGISVHPLDQRFGVPGDTRAFGLLERPRTPLRPDTSWRTFAGGARDAIHPGTTLEVAMLLGWNMPRRDPNIQVDWKDIWFRYSVFCEGFSLAEATLVIPAAEVAEAPRS